MMTGNKGRFATRSLCVLLSVAASRGEDALVQETMADQTPAYHLEELVVRAERNVLIELNRESAALDPVTLSLKEMDLQRIMPVSASDALAAAPGIHTETRGRKYKQFHSFRGQIYPYPDVLFDGIWQRDARELFYVYPGAMIQEVEIVRSPSTLFHGLADVVGVINVVPRQPKWAPDAPATSRLGVEGGSRNTFRAYGFHEGQAGQGQAFLIGGQHVQTDGRSQRNAAEKMTSAFWSHVFQLDTNHRVQAGGWILHGYRELERPDPDGPALNALKNRKERYDPITYAHINLRGNHLWSDQWSTEWKVFYSDRQARYKRVKLDAAGPGPGDTIANEDDREFGAQIIQGVALTPDNTLRVGGLFHRWTAPNGKQSYVGSRQDVSSVALVLSDEHRIGNWTLDAGFRYARSYYHDFSNPSFTIGGTSIQSRPVRGEWDKPVLSGTAGALMKLTERSHLYAHGGYGERRAGPGSVQVDGSSPSTERRYTVDTGWRTSWGAKDTGTLRAGLFGVWRRDAIVRISQTATDAEGNVFNLSGNQDLRQGGLEIEMQTPRLLDEHLFFFGGVTWMRSETKSSSGFEKYREVPSLTASGGGQVEIGAWDAALTARHVDQYENFRFAQDGNYHHLGDYLDVTLSIGVRLGKEKNIRLYALVENALDEAYSTVVGWTDPGRSYRAGLEMTF